MTIPTFSNVERAATESQRPEHAGLACDGGVGMPNEECRAFDQAAGQVPDVVRRK
jgi:hypothetical protein